MKLKIRILFVLLLAITGYQAKAQLAAGDIAIVGVNSDAVPDEFAIVALADIPSGQTIYISDYGWDGSSFSTTSNGTEGAITWTTTSSITAGTLLNFTIESPAGSPIITGDLATYGTVSATGWTLGSSAVASGGDNWFIYQGASPSSVPSTWVFGFANFSTNVGGTVTAGEWLPSGSPTSTTSQLPTALTLGTTAVGLTTTTYHADNMVYTGTLVGDKSSLLTSIGTRSNWNGSETITQDIAPGGTNFPGSNPVFTISTPNNPPTASSFTAANGPYENLTYTFSTSDFSYTDGDGDPLSHLLIESIPGAGTLYVDADNDDVYDGGEEVSVSDQVSKADLDAGNLQYIQNGSTSTSFQFEVNDGTENSTGNYIATLTVSPVPTVTLGVSPTSKSEAITTATTVTATLSNAYGINTIVNLAFSGTATNSTDYTASGSTITVTAGSTSGTITLNNINDALYESNETVIIDISSVPSGGVENGTQQVTYTITNDDAQPTASLLLRPIYNPIADESGGQAYIVGELSAVAGVTVSIPLSFTGTATGGGTDYSITGSVITISPGELMDSIRVTSIFDGIEEGDETVIIDMDTPTNASEDGTQQVTLTITDEDAAPPSGYSVSLDQSPINNGNESAVSFTFAGAEVGATYNYTFSSSGGGTNVTGSGTIATATDQISGIDLSGLGDGTITLSVTLTDGGGNTGAPATDTETKDTSVPTGYSVSIDQTAINVANETALSFTFAGAEVGTTYNYTFSSSGGGTNVTGSGTIASATEQISGIDLSGLGDGTVTLSVTLTDSNGNTGTAATDTKTKDTAAPSGYSVTMDQSPINNGNETAASFTFAGAEAGTTYNYTFSSSGGGTNVTGSGTIITATDQITGIDLSGLGDGTITLSVTLTDAIGNTGSPATDTETKETVPPSGYSVVIDQSPINSGNETSVSFTFAGAEVGATYNYTFSSSGGGTNVTGSGTVASATDQISGINLSGLGDGTITLSVTLTDTNGNIGSAATDTEMKDTTAPTGYAVVIDQSPINSENETAVSFTFADAEVGATYDYTFSSSGGGTDVTGSGTITTATDQISGIDLSGLGDATITLSVTLTDANGNTGSVATDTETKETVLPTGYSVVIDQSPVTSGNETAVSFTFADAEVGSTYNYTFSSSGGGTDVIGSGTIATATDQITGIDLSGLGDGTITLSVTLMDVNGNAGTAATDTEMKDTAAPAGYSVLIDQDPINSGNETVVSFTFADAEVDATYDYTFSSSGGGTDVTGSGTIATPTDQISGIDLSGLGDGTITLSVTLTDVNGNTGTAATDTKTKDTDAPTGYTVAFDQSAANADNSTAISFTFAGAEVGTTYNYTISSSGGGTDVTGTGTIATATDQISGIDVSGLNDGTLTLSATLTDAFENTGASAIDNIQKDVIAPSGYSVAIDLMGESIITVSNQTVIEFLATDLETGTTSNYSFTSENGGTPVTGTETVTSTSQQFDNGGAGYDLSGLQDGTITLTITLTDAAGNTGAEVTDQETKDADPPTGYSVAWNDMLINASEAATASFTVSGAEIGATINNTVSSSGDGNTATVSNPTTVTSNDQVVTIDVSSLTDGVLIVEVTLTDGGGNTGGVVSDNSATLDQTAPSGYSVTVDQASISSGNESAVSFTFAGAEAGATYDYTFSSSEGGTDVTGSGTIATATDQITGIDISGLPDGTITLSVTLTDPAGNTGDPATDTVIKDASAPTFISVDDNGGDNSYRSGESLTIVADLGETGLTVTADLSVINSGLSTNAALTDNGDGTYSITISDVDDSGNMIEGATIAVPLTATDASNNQQTDSSLTLNLDKTAPVSFTVAIDQADINAGNQNAVSFTFAGAETGTTYSYTFSSSGGGTDVTGSGTIATANEQITGIDLSGLADGTVTLSVTLTDAAGNEGAPATDSVDKMAASIQFSTTSSSDSESVASASLQVDLSTTSAQNITVDYTVSGTATGGGTDYTLADGTLTISAGDASGNINITDIVDDLLVEEDETIIVTLSNATNATLGANTVHTYTIIDNDVKLPQEIVFEPISDKRVGDDPVQLEVTGGDSGLPITFTITTQPTSGVATLSNGTITIEGAGSVSVTASQAGNDMYEPAEGVTRTFEILPGELFLPTLFSPNDDEMNDRFILRGGADIAQIELSIFDREGNLVYSSNSFAELTQSGWDGTNKGTLQPQGAYVWVVRGSFADGSPLLINGRETGIIRLAR